MAEEKVFLNGIKLFKKKETQPEWVIASGVLTPDDLNTFLIDNKELMTEYNGKQQLRIQILKSKEGAPYIQVDTWKPNAATEPAKQGFDSTLPDEDPNLPF